MRIAAQKVSSVFSTLCANHLNQVLAAMNLAEFKSTISLASAPEGLPDELLSLWKAQKGDWAGAHALVEDDPGDHAAWVHAYLHRVEGDDWNAGYWYRRAGKKLPHLSLEEEWESIVAELLMHLT